MNRWHDDDDFWAFMGEAMWTPERLASADAEVDWIVRTLGLGAGAAVLDMPCGVGRHSLALAARGCRVTGVDRTLAYLERARASTPTGTTIDWVRADMRTYDGGARFDAVTNLYSSFGYFEHASENLAAARAFRQALRPGGHLVLDTHGKEILARSFRPRWWTQLPGGTLHLEEATPIDAFRRIANRWISITPGGQRRERSTTLWVYSAGELATILADAGFEEPRFFGGFDGSAYDHAAKRLVLIARAR